MAILYRSTPREKVLYVQIKGEFVMEFAQEHFLEKLLLLRKHRCPKVLVDGREILGDPKPVERFFYGAFVADAVDKFRGQYMPFSPLPFAYVLSEPTLDPKRLGEIAATNRGMNVRAFD